MPVSQKQNEGRQRASGARRSQRISAQTAKKLSPQSEISEYESPQGQTSDDFAEPVKSGTKESPITVTSSSELAKPKTEVVDEVMSETENIGLDTNRVVYQQTMPETVPSGQAVEHLPP